MHVHVLPEIPIIIIFGRLEEDSQCYTVLSEIIIGMDKNHSLYSVGNGFQTFYLSIRALTLYEGIKIYQHHICYSPWLLS